MGYYTYFTLEMEPESQDIWDAINDNDELHYVFGTNGNDGQSAKWYDHEEDMKEFSKLFPDVLFTLKGEGEENSDMWIKYFKNGKMQACYAVIIYPPFDENKLE